MVDPSNALIAQRSKEDKVPRRGELAEGWLARISLTVQWSQTEPTLRSFFTRAIIGKPQRCAYAQLKTKEGKTVLKQ